MKIGKYLVGLVSGLTFGMLFAPKKGQKLRDEMKKKGATHDGVNVLIDAFREAGMEAMEEAKKLSEHKEMGQMLDASKEKMKEYLTKLETTGYDIATRAQEKLDELYETTSKSAVGFKRKALKKKKQVKKAVNKAIKSTEKKVKKATPKKMQVKVKQLVKKAKGKKG